MFLALLTLVVMTRVCWVLAREVGRAQDERLDAKYGK